MCLFLPFQRVILFDELLNSNEFLHTFYSGTRPLHPCAQTVATITVQQMPPQSHMFVHCPKDSRPTRLKLTRLWWLQLEVNSAIQDVNPKISICHLLFTEFAGSISEGKMLGFSCVGRTTVRKKVIEVMTFHHFDKKSNDVGTDSEKDFLHMGEKKRS